jgi:hypothetical protein
MGRRDRRLPAEGRRATTDHDRTDRQVQSVHQTMGQQVVPERAAAMLPPRPRPLGCLAGPPEAPRWTCPGPRRLSPCLPGSRGFRNPRTECLLVWFVPGLKPPDHLQANLLPGPQPHRPHTAARLAHYTEPLRRRSAAASSHRHRLGGHRQPGPPRHRHPARPRRPQRRCRAAPQRPRRHPSHALPSPATNQTIRHFAEALAGQATGLSLGRDFPTHDSGNPRSAVSRACTSGSAVVGRSRPVPASGPLGIAARCCDADGWLRLQQTDSYRAATGHSK